MKVLLKKDLSHIGCRERFVLLTREGMCAKGSFWT